MCYSVMVQQDIRSLETLFGAVPVRRDFDSYQDLVSSNPKKFKDLKEHPRIYPNYWAPIVTQSSAGERLISPMRYRVRPAWSEKEVPTKYNLFNARLDSLETRKTWSGLYRKRHGVLVMVSFFEWVQDRATGKKKVVQFSPRDHSTMLVPVLWDEWQAPDGSARILSFAVITTDPNPEVLAAGHDRSPIFMQEKFLSTWLNPQAHSRQELYQVLQNPEQEFYEVAAAKP